MKFFPSSLKQREEFYKYEFDIEIVKKWFKKNKLPYPQIFAVDMGSETGIIKDKEKKGKMINLRAEHIEKKLLKYLPEDAYYDRNTYKNPEAIMKSLDFRNAWSSGNLIGQELAFDIDPENIKCSCKKKFPRFCEKCMPKTVENAIILAERLKQRFERIGLVYSGRGMHVHVFDKEAFKLSIKEREENNKLAKGLGTDPWVSRGYIRLIRLPYSLNGLVSRIVLPLTLQEAKNFNPLTSKKTIPKFIQQPHSSSLS